MYMIGVTTLRIKSKDSLEGRSAARDEDWFLSETSVHIDLCLIGMVLGSLGWARTHFVVKDNSELLILLPPPSKCWDYKRISPCPAQIVHFIFKSYIQSHLLYYSLHICFRSHRNGNFSE